MSTEAIYHLPVLLHECIQQLNIQEDGVYLDATFGGGGHSKAILQKLGDKGKLIVFDQDEDAKRNLPDDNRIIFIQENFRYAARFVRMLKLEKLNGVLADLGVSSYQFDTAERGFSTRFDAALDMRMDHRNPLTAAKILNTYHEKNLQMLFENFGEITNAKALAKRIVDSRNQTPFTSIQTFKQVCESVMYGNPNKYLAQVFQALRMEVNDEIHALHEFLSTITNRLSPQARLCIITFHSLEDRPVKQWMKTQTFQESNNVDFSVQEKKKKLSLKVITKKPILPSQEEEAKNPRSRSAKLRVAEKV
jgi:16S rRNA (cytosine1402-N4)-methyltransferase